MIIVAYDFSSNKRRQKFSKFLSQYGERIQYSVFRIKNSQRLLDIIITEVENEYKSKFKKTDNILIFQICSKCEKNILRYGSASYEDKDVIYF